MIGFGMGDLVNLRRARKAKARGAAEEKAAVNRLAHGTAKNLRDAARAEKERAAHNTEAHRLDET